MNKIKQITMAMLFLAATVVAPVFLVSQTALAANDLQDQLCAGVELDVDGNCESVNSEDSKKGVNDLVKEGINIFSWIVGIISVVMIMVGGVKYITSQGSSENVTTAKNTILYAVIGLVVVALAQVIVRFVLNKSLNVTN